MKIVALRDNVVVRPAKAAETSKGGIVLTPGEYKESPTEGTVIGIGPKVTMVKKGDHVIFQKYAGTCIDPDDKDIILMKEEDLLAVIT